MTVTKSVLESPFKNDNQSIFNDNYFYVNACARKIMLENDVAPLFFHTLYTQFLSDNKTEERNIGLFRSFEYHSHADEKLYAIDRGISGGMILGAEDAIKKGMPIKFFTVHPASSKVGKKISEINSIEDNQTRWNAGLEFVSSLTSDPLVEKRFSLNGDLTNYKHEIREELSDVKKCILEFFEPLVKSIRKEMAKEKCFDI